MGLGPAAVKLYLELRQRGLLDNVERVMDMGSQELHLSRTALEKLVGAAGISEYDAKSFQELSHWPKKPWCSAMPFYQLLGAKQYQCLDINGEHNAIPHDLNSAFTDTSLYGQFDLVTDHGNNEHVFNVAETYRTMHLLCKTEGIMVCMQAVFGGNGYFNFDPAFFEGMAAANNYRILFSSYFLTLKRTHLSDEDLRSQPLDPIYGYGIDQFHIPLSKELLDTVNWAKDGMELGICYVFQKLSDDDFNFAYQGELDAQQQEHEGYRLQFLPTPPSRAYIPLRGSTVYDFSGTSFRVLLRLNIHLLRRLITITKLRLGLGRK